VDMTLNLLIIL